MRIEKENIMSANLDDISEVVDTICHEYVNDHDENSNEVMTENFKDVGVELSNKLCDIGLYVKKIQSHVSAIDSRIEELKKRKELLCKKEDGLHSYILNHMNYLEKDKLSNAFVTLRKNKSKSLKIIDEHKVPDQFKKTKSIISVDKMAIREEMKHGVIIDGVELITHEYVVIK